MRLARSFVSTPLPVILTLATWLALTMTSAAQKPVKSTPPPKGQDADATRLQEADAVCQAVITLAGANHDYDGHRWRAIEILREGVKLLDEHIAKSGTPQQKLAMAQQVAAVKTAIEEAKQTKALHERQKLSDSQLRAAHKLLAKVKPTFVAHKQKKLLEIVDSAMKEINIALQIR